MRHQGPYFIELHFYDFVEDDVVEYITTEWKKRFVGNDDIGPCKLEIRHYTRPSVDKQNMEHYMAVVKAMAQNEEAKNLLIRLFEDAHDEHVDEMSAPNIRAYK